ncbi:MAG: PilZ domain-containing protein [Polyangia bacterium]|jgi:hypothetical protein
MSTTEPQARAPRFPVRIGAELRLEGRTLTGTTRNLSSGGVCLEIDRPLTEGALVRLTLFSIEDDVETEGARGLDLTGTVQWSAEADRGYAIGIKFGNLSASQAKALERALKVVSPQ